MGYYRTRGLRGSSFEELINRTNKVYFDDDLAVMQKLPTAIKPVELDSNRGVITLAYFDEQSTVDYIGSVQGIPVCFDAKETALASLPLSNIHRHQVEFMRKFIAQGGIAFLLVHFTGIDKIFAADFELIRNFWEQVQNQGRKSIPYTAIDPRQEVLRDGRYLIHYLPVLNILFEKQEMRKTN